MPRITRREDKDPVPEAAQVMCELLQGDRETVQEGEKLQVKKPMVTDVLSLGFLVSGFGCGVSCVAFHV